MNVFRRLLASGNVEIAPPRRAGADENRVVFLVEHVPQAVDVGSPAKLDADVQDVADFFVYYRFGKSELRNLGANHAAGLPVAVEDRDLVAKRRQVARNGK